MSSLLTRKRPKPTINVVPLMDVLTILIFFFLVSMQFKEMTTLNLTLPSIESAGKNEFPDKIQISIDEEGVIYLETQPVDVEELKAVISQLSDLSNDIPVLIRAHKLTPLETVTDVMDACRLNGLSKIRLQSR
ncbi:biopolymer transporter ExbD [Pelagicoccus sp. NFK12]|uniref:Biopolymer transporter ExbD n=1 Tax=Pelagicoccus enzymogenes TaxID=2773457 RepID=A0A927F8K9_9BACT|nr:biopolymer transporter ExbD [Pelagicoccus enzymogenes]MBD5780307.1 biopolymer transporter ExbD [Pelagicoccus enzymogenes]MDQ8197790.1 biopolymer transporter ExbD [Pelagicoccus enzymogenes]